MTAENNQAQDGEELQYPFDQVPEFGACVEIMDGLLWLRMPLMFDLDHINLYLVRDGEGWAFIDTGISTSKVRELWLNVIKKTLGGAPVTKVIVTHFHPDHIGLAGWLCAETGAPLYMTALENLTLKNVLANCQDEVPNEVINFYYSMGMEEDMVEAIRKMGYANFARIADPLPFSFHRMREGDVLNIGAFAFEIWIGRGHSPEHACLYDRKQNVLISGDQILPRISSNVSVHAQEPMANPLRDWLTSLATFMAVDKDCLVLPAHNEPFKGIHKRLQELIMGHVRRLERIMAHEDNDFSAFQAFPVLFRRKLKGFDMILGIGESVAHLHFLESLGCLERYLDGKVVRFKKIANFDSQTLLSVLGLNYEQP